MYDEKLQSEIADIVFAGDVDGLSKYIENDSTTIFTIFICACYLDSINVFVYSIGGAAQLHNMLFPNGNDEGNIVAKGIEMVEENTKIDKLLKESGIDKYIENNKELDPNYIMETIYNYFDK